MARMQFDKLWASFLALGTRRLMALALVGVGVMAMIAAGTYYLSRPVQELLYGGLSRDDVSRIGAALREVGIDFDVSSDGTSITVAYGDTARARMILAEKGLPQSTDSGYELFNQVGSFGLTSFMQEVTKTRALEGELARTIQGMTGVKAARVHLVLPDRNSFRSEQQEASASVVIRTEMPGDASPAQAIRHLVAAGVPGLKIDNVTVLSTDGTVLAAGEDAGSASAGRMAMIEQTVNRDIEEKIRRTLTPYLGLGNFQLSVVSRLNLDRKTVQETIFDPASRVERSVRTIRQNDLTQNRSSGTPTSVQEELPDQKTGGGGDKTSNETNERREELTNYEVSSKTIETSHDGYEIVKLSIAVLINKDRLVALLSQSNDQTPIEHQLMELEQLVASAAGLSKERGDQLKVAAVSFVDNVAVEPEEPGLMDVAMGHVGTAVNALAVIVVAVLVIILGLRPAVKAILTARPAESSLPVAVAANQAGGTAAVAAEGGAADTEPVNLIEDVARKMNRTPQKRLEQIVELDEAEVAAVLRQWLRQQSAA